MRQLRKLISESEKENRVGILISSSSVTNLPPPYGIGKLQPPGAMPFFPIFILWEYCQTAMISWDVDDENNGHFVLKYKKCAVHPPPRILIVGSNPLFENVNQQWLSTPRMQANRDTISILSKNKIKIGVKKNIHVEYLDSNSPDSVSPVKLVQDVEHIKQYVGSNINNGVFNPFNSSCSTLINKYDVEKFILFDLL